MKIGIVRQRYVQSGGAEQYLNAVAMALGGRGHEVHLFAHSWRAHASDRIHFHKVPRISTTSFLRALSFALFCQPIVRRAHCDLIFSLERTLRQDVYRAGDGCHREWLAQRARYSSPLKRGAIRVNPLHTTLVALEKRTFSSERTGWVIANSERGREEIRRHYGFPGERIFVIHNGVDVQRFVGSPLRKPDGLVHLLFVGTGFERKGLRFCVEALRELPTNFRLQIVGKGRTSEYQRLASRLGVADRVRFLGFDLEMPAVYAQSDLLVHPAIYEPFANVCLEAMACGLPVVTSAINGASELIENGRNGAVVADPSDTAELVQAVALFADDRRRARASLAARATAEAHPFSDHVDRTLEVLQLACAEKARRRAPI